MHNKFIITIVLTIVLVGVGVVAYQRLTPDKEGPKKHLSEKTETSHWKTYKSDQFRFSIWYPTTFSAYKRVFSTESAGGIEFEHSDGYSMEFVARRVFRGRSKDPCDPPAQKQFPQQRDVRLDGVVFTKTTGNRQYPISYTGETDDICYRFTLSNTESEPLEIEARSMFEDMVSTVQLQ